MGRRVTVVGVVLLAVAVVAGGALLPLVLRGEDPVIRRPEPGPADRAPRGFPVEPDEIPPEIEADYRQSVPPDGIRPIYDPDFVPADEARIEDDDLVIGVEIEGVARAYPVGALNFREMVNDRIGAVPFLVTW